MICVYESDCTDFSNNGLGVLAPSSCKVNETLNGEWELTLEHPIDGQGKWQRLVEDRILRAPVPAAMTPRVRMMTQGADDQQEIYRINTSISEAETYGGTLRLRSGPGTGSSVLKNYKNGTEVELLEKTNGTWFEVLCPDGKRGYMMVKYLNYVRTEGSIEEAVSAVVEPRQLRDQPFRIYRVVPELTKVTAYARHLTYDLLDNMIQQYDPSSSATGATVVHNLSSQCLSPHPFTFYSNLESTAEEVKFEHVNPIEALLGEGGVVEKYTAELARDWYDIYLVQRVGQDTSVDIREGKNLLGISYDVDETDVVTRIMPTGQDADGNVLYLPELFIDSPNIEHYPHPKWIHLEVSDAKEVTSGDDQRTKEQCYAMMRSEVQKKFDAECDLPTITLQVDFLNCANTEEYKAYAALQEIYMGDSVRVVAPRIGVSVTMRLVQYTYDCLIKKYTSMTLGTAAASLADSTISGRQLPSGVITGSKLALNSVGSGALQSGSVGSLQVKLGAIETAHIQDAAIQTAKIADAAIGTAKIQDAAVTKAKIGSAAVGTAQIEDAAIVKAKIAEGAIGSAQIEDAAITRAKIGSAAIGAAQIEDGVITGAKIGTAEVGAAHIQAAAIGTAKIHDAAVTKAKIGSAAVGTAQIEDAAITNAKIGGAAVGTANIQDAAIVAAKILDGEIVTAKIADLAVTSGKIADLAVTTAKIAQAAITNAKIANAAVGTAQIVLGAITQALIAQGAVGTAQIADASITAAKVVSLNADVITSGTLATERLIITGDDGVIYEINAESSGLSLAELSDQKYREKLNGTVLVARSITAEQIAAATITANEILAGTITGDKIAAATIEGSNIKAGAITTSHVSSNFGQTLDLSSNTGINLRVQQIYSDMDAAIAAAGGGEVVVGTQTAATASWTGNASFTELNDGQQIVYWLPYGSASNVTLNLTLANDTTTGPIPCYYGGTTRLSTQYTAGNAIRLIYRVNAMVEATAYTGWWADANYNSNTNYYDRINYKALVTAVGAIDAGRLGVFNSAGKLMLLSTTAFDVTKPILYVGTAYTASALTQTNNYISWGTAFSLKNTVSTFSGTAGATVYIKGTLNGKMFTPAAGVLTTTVPTSDDGYTYMLLGLMSTTVNGVLAPEHPMFRYYNGGFKTILQISYEAFVAAEEAQDAIDTLEVGGRNYLLKSGDDAESGNFLIGSYEVSEPLVEGQEYTVSMCVSPASDVTSYLVYLSDGYQEQCQIPVSGVAREIIHKTFVCHYYAGRTPTDNPANSIVTVYRSPQPSGTVASSKIHWIKIEKGNRATDWTAAPEDAEETMELKLASVRATINTEADSIRQEVQATYALASDMTQVRGQVSTLSEQTEQNYTWSVTRINQLQQDMEAAQEATEEQLAIMRTYMTFSDDGLVIGKTGNPFTFRVVNDRLAFYMNDTEVAYLSNNKLYVTQAEILSKLIIGKFAFEPQINGNLSLVYKG